VANSQREGVLVTPKNRLSHEQVNQIDGASRELLSDPGMLCYNENAANVFRKAGAKVESAGDCLRVFIPPSLIDSALETAPSTVVLGARDPANRLVLDAHEPRVRFGSGSETNVWLELSGEDGELTFHRQRGSVDLLSKSAHLGQHLDNLDFFIRNVNIQDDFVTVHNKDVNVFFASLDNITKHVQAGLTEVDSLDRVLQLGEMAAGGKESFQSNPLLSFITCVIKSPLQMVDDTAAKLIEISKRRVPVVISSCPMGGATGPFDESGMVTLINAELLAGITLNQLVAPGTPVLYGAVPVRTRLDNMNDMYAAAEFVHYNLDCAQMARHYGLPCYSSAGIADASEPGIQATAEKMFTLSTVPASGAQYIHYAFGLLDRTNIFCPEQAVLDDAHIDLVKRTLRNPEVDTSTIDKSRELVREVMATAEKTFMYHVPLPSRESVYARFPLEDNQHGALAAAHRRYQEILERPRKSLDEKIRDDILRQLPDIHQTATSSSSRKATQ
jgi:trimethylamine--corrinoid protein Co-methyltransferase